MIPFEKKISLGYISKPFYLLSRVVGGPQGREQGFTLIEIIVAVIIMGLAYVVILQSFSLSARNIAKVEGVRNDLLQYSLEFEQQALDKRLSTQEGVEVNEDIFMAGSRYQLLLVSDESEMFMTLRLEKL